MIRSLARWILRGEQNVTTALERLSSDLRDLQRRVDDLYSVSSSAPSSQHLQRPEEGVTKSDGINVVGYLQHQLALGDCGRQVTSSLIEFGLPVAALTFEASPSPRVDPPFPTDERAPYATTIAVVAADQIPLLHEVHPSLFQPFRRVIGYCYWELEHLPPSSKAGALMLDELWVATQFIRHAFESSVDTPVRIVPRAVPEPRPSNRTSEDFEPLKDRDNRVVVACTFDYHSSVGRKNPLGAIEAYRRAVTTEDVALLVVKTLNADSHQSEHRRLLAASSDRSDIRIWDAQLSDADQAAFLASIDILLSLHRSEGFGLHLAEAMWLRKAVIATGWSGNLDFMDHTCSRLVRHGSVEVVDHTGIYPSGTRWADPDLNQAADHLRTLIFGPELRVSLGAAAHARMASRPTERDVARLMAKYLSNPPSSGA